VVTEDRKLELLAIAKAHVEKKYHVGMKLNFLTQHGEKQSNMASIHQLTEECKDLATTTLSSEEHKKHLEREMERFNNSFMPAFQNN